MIRISDTDEAATRRLHLPRIAVLASVYPARSETFVYREVMALRRRGWGVQTISLHDPPELVETVLGQRQPASVIVYDEQLKQTLLAAMRESVTHPIRSTGTLGAALADIWHARKQEPHRHRFRALFQAVAAIGLANRLRACGGVAMLHCHFAHAPATVGMYCARQLDIPFSFVGHANDLLQRRTLLEPKLKRCSFAACISTWHRSLYRELVSRGDEDYPVIRCGVEVGTWGTIPHRDHADGHRLLTLGRLVEKKGIDTLIRALSQLRRADREWQLTIAGGGPDGHRLRALAKHLDCNEAIHWLGPVDAQQVPKLMAAADVFALPCREDQRGDRDGIPVVLMEAMAAGLPVVAGDLPSIRDLVQHDSTGLLVPGDDPTMLAEQLTRLQRDPTLRKRLAHAGREHVAKEFSQAINIERLENALRESLGLGSLPIARTLQRSVSQRTHARAAV